MYALIMAGGSGTRLWPKSRKDHPKQLHPLVTKNSLIQETVKQITPLVPPQKVFIVTNKSYVGKIKKQIPKVPKKNILCESQPLGTASAVGLGMIELKKIDPYGKVVVLWSDSHIQKKKNFISALKLAEKVAGKRGVIIGVNPTFPSTAYGYIQIGSGIERFGKMKVFEIKRFIEKPDIKKAKEFLDSWQYLWNPGISVWKVSKFLQLFKKFLPKHFKALTKVEKVLGRKEEQEVMAYEFKNLDPIPIDYAIYEKAKNLAVVPANLGWSDIGNWAALKDLLSKTKKANVVKGEHLGIDTSGSLIHGYDRLIVTVGMKDIIVVDSDDVVLVCSKDKAQDVKKVVEKLKKDGKDHYL
jgi:mannose-1-phosphate guanylyltransferase